MKNGVTLCSIGTTLYTTPLKRVCVCVCWRGVCKGRTQKEGKAGGLDKERVRAKKDARDAAVSLSKQSLAKTTPTTTVKPYLLFFF
jgi:hypothetical protein